jgi:hypothetical protein
LARARSCLLELVGAIVLATLGFTGALFVHEVPPGLGRTLATLALATLLAVACRLAMLEGRARERAERR